MKYKRDSYDFDYEINNDEIIITKCNNGGFEGEVIFPAKIDNIEVKKIADYCCEFDECCWNVSKTITIEEGIEEIGDFAFSTCIELEKIIIPSSVRKIGSNIFKDCKNLKEIIINNDNPIYTSCNNSNIVVKKNTMSLVYGTKASMIPDCIKIIESHAFGNIKDLETIIINEGCEILKPCCIENCPNLKNVFISSTVKCANNAIKDCYFISKIIVDNKNKYIEYNEILNDFENIESKVTPLPLCDFTCTLTFEGNGYEYIEISYEIITDKIYVNFNGNRISFICGKLYKEALSDLSIIMGYVKENIINNRSNFGLMNISSNVRCAFCSKDYTDYSIVIKDENLYIKLISIVEYISPFTLNLLRNIPDVKYSIDDMNLEYITIPDIYNDMFDTYKQLNGGANHPNNNDVLKIDSNSFSNRNNLKFIKIRKADYILGNNLFDNCNNLKKIVVDDLDILNNISSYLRKNVERDLP